MRNSFTTIWKNGVAMPLPLKLLSSAALILLLFCVWSALPQVSIRIFGRHISYSDWWSSGAGFATIVVSCLMIVAVRLMLARSEYGRPVYILGWIVLSALVPFIAWLTGIEVAKSIPSLVSNLVLTILIAAYLYKSKASRDYF